MPWVSRRLRGDRVWVRANADGQVALGSDGRVDILYRQGGKVYRAALRNLEADEPGERWTDAEAAPGQGQPAAAPGSPGATAPASASAPGPKAGGEPIYIWADGACTGNPGPCGIGIVVLDGRQRAEVSEYLGPGTNNIAELTAIIRALERAPSGRPLVIHTDSAYAVGLLSKNWKPKANQELVARMRTLAAAFPDLRVVKVAGHSGIVENERADALAREAVVRRASRTSP